MIDNYDSFTYNLVQYFETLGEAVLVQTHDTTSLNQIEQLAPDYIVISPGPGNPDEAGISMAVIEHFAGKLPLLGVCLGHQCIAQTYGGRIVRAKAVMHGKTSDIHHEGKGIFRNLKPAFTATRYHSLVVDPDTLPGELEITAWTNDAEGERLEIMGIAHRTLPLYGVQFHPESILTEAGFALLDNFLQEH